MNEERQNRIIVVTGAGTGIGRATARAFAARGDRVLAVGRRPAPLAETAAGHPLITPVVADVTAENAPARVVGEALDSGATSATCSTPASPWTTPGRSGPASTGNLTAASPAPAGIRVGQ
ncbi:SDR family NAD(P)-dependent oxidoreductase [Micromonospora mirobrigensis]